MEDEEYNEPNLELAVNVRASIPNKSCPRRAGGRRWFGRFLLASALIAATGSPLAASSAEKNYAAKRLVAETLATPESAASIARIETGGRVLSVTPLKGAEGSYRVRLLLEGGRVTTILVGPQGGVRGQR